MKKMNFKWLVVLCMAIGIVTVAKAQIYSSEICYYGKVSGDGPRWYVVKFVGGSVRIISGYSDDIKGNLEKSKNYYENNDVWNRHSNTDDDPWKYNASLSSTYNKEIYFQHWNASPPSVFNPQYIPERDYYLAFTKDLSSFIRWEEHKDGSIIGKEYYTRISKEDILPKSANHDFLYD